MCCSGRVTRVPMYLLGGTGSPCTDRSRGDSLPPLHDGVPSFPPSITHSGLR